MSVFNELFPNTYDDIDPEPIVRAICALADEIRAQRLQDREFYEADRAADAEQQRIRQEQQRELVDQMSGMRSDIKALPQSETHFMVPSFPPPALEYGYGGFMEPKTVRILRCECEHGIAAHSQPGTACDLCDCKQFRTPGLTEEAAK